MTLDLEIQGLTPINTADGLNRWSRQRLRKAWEGKVASAVLMALGRWPAAPLDRARVTIVRCSTREPDFENLAQGGKFILDGLVKAGVIVDDSPVVIGRPDYRWERAPRGQGSVRVRVEAIAETHDHRDTWERGPHEGVEIGPRVVSSSWLDGTGGGGC